MVSRIPQEVLDHFIEVNYDISNSDGEKENRKIRQPNTTEEQTSKMLAFAKDNNEGLISKETFNLLWENLAAELNDVGPPDHTPAEWKKIWSEYKKRKISRNESIDAIEKGGFDQSFRDAHPGSEDQRVDICEPAVSNQIEVVIAKQDVTIENQNVLIGLHKTIIEKLDVITDILQKIATNPH